MPKLDLDFETYSPLDITQVGAHKYAMHPETEVLMAAWGVDHGPVNLWVPAEGQPMPAQLEALLCDPNVEVHAFNAQFERLILWHVLGYRVPVEQFRCTMTHAWTLSFSGGLAAVGEQMGLGQDQRKLTTGKQLINRFCKPAPSNHKADRYTRFTHPDEWARFKEYCVQDVVAEREIALLLAGYPMHPDELDLWFWDQEVNDRGVPVDVELVNAAVYLEGKEKAHLRHEMNSLTHLENANSNPQLMQWLSVRGVHLPNMQAETLAKACKEIEDPLILQVLEMKSGVAKVSTTKWQAFQRATCDDGYLRGMFQFGGAQRTQRWAGRIVQLHNLKRPGKAYEKTIDRVVDVLLTRDLDIVHALVDDVLGLLSEGVRCAITAPTGYSLAPCDLGSIESRVLGYVSGCERINRIFREGKDTYKDFAMELFNVPYAHVTKDQRGYSKPPTLGCGYQLGGPGLVAYAESMGVDMPLEDAKRAVSLYREIYPEVPLLWQWLIESCKEVTEQHVAREGYTVRVYRDPNFLFIHLPSGRRLAYYQPLVLPMVPPWEKERVEREIETMLQLYPEMTEEQAREEVGPPHKVPTLTYLGMNQYSKKWERLTTHGGKITENCLAGGTQVLTSRGWVRIEDVQAGDWVHDGVEFVPHGGVVFKSVQPCVTVDGVHMTADHEVLTHEGWKTASTDPRPFRPDLRGVDNTDPGTQRREKEVLALPVYLWAPVREDRRGRAEGSEARRDAELRVHDRAAHRREEHHPRADEASRVRGVGVDAGEVRAEDAPGVEGLRRPWHRRVPKVGRVFRTLLGGYGPYVRAGSGPGPQGQRRAVFAGELPVGAPEAEHHEPAKLGSGGGRARAIEGDRDSEVDALLQAEAGVAARGDHPRPRPRKPVYDILNCGPRHRFVVRGAWGPFVVHNCIQAIARDVLAFHMRKTEEYLGPIIRGHVHDEQIPMVLQEQAPQALQHMEQIMSIAPPWAPSMLLGAKGFITRRYKKD